MPPAQVINEALWAHLQSLAASLGFLRLGIVALDDPGFEGARAALDEHVQAHHYGDMAFMGKTHEVRRDPRLMLPSASTLLMVAVPHRGGSSSVARYAQGVDYHTVIHRRLATLVEHLESALPGVETLICVDTKPVMERAAAALAGLGFLGKNGCLIVPGVGSYVLLGGVLCSARMPSIEAPERSEGVPWDACGSCRRCLDACPTDAFLRPGVLDARRCISYLTIESRSPIPDATAERMGKWVAGCDVCQEVCPYNASPRRFSRVAPRTWLEERPNGSEAVDLVALSEIGSSRYRAWVRGSALNRIPRRSLRRNALIALGNRNAPLSGREHAALERLQRDDDPQIRAAARRALRRRDLKVTDSEP